MCGGGSAVCTGAPTDVHGCPTDGHVVLLRRGTGEVVHGRAWEAIVPYWCSWRLGPALSRSDRGGILGIVGGLVLDRWKQDARAVEVSVTVPVDVLEQGPGAGDGDVPGTRARARSYRGAPHELGFIPSPGPPAQIGEPAGRRVPALDPPRAHVHHEHRVHP